MSNVYWAGLVYHGWFRHFQYSIQLVDETGHTLVTLYAHAERELKEHINQWLSVNANGGKMYTLVGEFPHKTRSAR